MKLSFGLLATSGLVARRLAALRVIGAVVSAALAAGACSPHSGKGGEGDASVLSIGDTPLPCDVDQVMALNCRFCHASPPIAGAPMPLVTYGDLHATSRPDPIDPVGADVPVYVQVGVRIHDTSQPMPQPPSPLLGAAALSTLDAWIEAGAPPGTGSCSGASATSDAGGSDSGVSDAGASDAAAQGGG